MNFFSKFENHSLTHLQDTLEEAALKTPGFISVLENHHAYLKESIEVLIDLEVAPESKQFHLSRLLHIVNMHARAEEETLYRRLARDEHKSTRIEGISSQEEHDLIYQLADDLDELGFNSHWSEAIDAKARVVAHLMRNHINQEEKYLFTLAKDVIDSEEMMALSEAYVEKCRNYLDEELDASRFTPSPGPDLPL